MHNQSYEFREKYSNRPFQEDGFYYIYSTEPLKQSDITGSMKNYYWCIRVDFHGNIPARKSKSGYWLHPPVYGVQGKFFEEKDIIKMIEKEEKDLTNKFLNKYKVGFDIKFRDDKEQFIKYWADVLGMDEKEFERKFIINDYDLFDDEDFS